MRIPGIRLTAIIAASGLQGKPAPLLQTSQRVLGHLIAAHPRTYRGTALIQAENVHSREKHIRSHPLRNDHSLQTRKGLGLTKTGTDQGREEMWSEFPWEDI